MSHVLGFLLLCFTVLGDTSKDDPLERVYASVGLSAILPCRRTIPENSEVPTIEWSKAGLEPSFVFVYRNFEIYELKHKDFQFRTHLFMTELHHGNFSMRLSEVRQTDAGKYLCKTLWNKDRHEVITVELVIEGSGGSCTFPTLAAGLGSAASALVLVGVGFLIHKHCSKSDEKKKIDRQSSDETTTSRGSETTYLLTPKDTVIIISEEPPDLVCSTPTSTVSKADSRNGSMVNFFPDVTDNAAATASKLVKFANTDEDERKTLTRQDAHADDKVKSTFSLSRSPNKKTMSRSKSISDPCSATVGSALLDLQKQYLRRSLSVTRFDAEKPLQKVLEERETGGLSPKRENDKRKTLTRQDAHADDKVKSIFSLSKHPNKKMTTRSKSVSDPCSATVGSALLDLQKQCRRHSLSTTRFDTEKLLENVPEELETDGLSPKVGR